MQGILRVLITGTSRGLGRHLVENLLKNIPEVQIYALARESLPKAKERWNSDKVKCFQFALGNRESYVEIANYFSENQIYLNAIVNNAAVLSNLNPSILTLDGAKQTMNINVTETIEFTKQMIKFLALDGRVVNVSSKMGALNKHPKHTVQKYFHQGITEENIAQAIKSYLQDVAIGTYQQNWGGKDSFSDYCASKMLLNSWSKHILSKKLLKEKQVAICMSPGHCRTDMGGKEAPQSAEYGANCIARCITMKEPSANFFYHKGNVSDYLTCGQNIFSQILQ